MNKTPSILVDTGFEVDQNGILTELDIPNVVDTLQAPSKVTFSGTTLSWIPSNAANLQEFDAPNAKTVTSNAFVNYSNLINANFDKLEAHSVSVGADTQGGLFNNCTSLASASLPSLLSITLYGGRNSRVGMFFGCVSLTDVNLASLSTIKNSHDGGYNGSGIFFGCTSLTTVSLPSIVSITDGNNLCGTFKGCTGLTSVQLGSEEHPVSAIGSYTFSGCTQSNLTITIYTTGGASLAGEPWGATNATIEYEEA